ncbi:MAG: UDP-glucose 4-epimerase GalE [Candidatus Kurthia intestinigallinarum]|uniref:UDP-glucose 4-epimerase GalE n=1 Tax=Kurthia sp. Dielmo TaxID=1033738 RepID=UPI0011213E4E|nr:UDP-glucose 4-epimerase GalE [Kurthia sp. Dielmo]
MRVLVTGGAGYIGSMVCIELLNEGHELFIVDNFSNSDASAITKIMSITGKMVQYANVDITDRNALEVVFRTYSFDSVIHLAGKKSVTESIENPLQYYYDNLIGTVMLVQLMQQYGVHSIIFSSSATVYHPESICPIQEIAELKSSSPYGRTKLAIENFFRELCDAHPTFSAVLLRYFNPIGAHSSGEIGEKPLEVPNNLLPYLMDAVSGKRPPLEVFGNDYDTIDGSGIRDFIHVEDLAKGHIKALYYSMEHMGCESFNLGSGTGYSVLQLIETFATANKIEVPYNIGNRRPGDIAISFADITKAQQILGWQPLKNLTEMCQDAWRWQLKLLQEQRVEAQIVYPTKKTV